ncbi:hypothetical protein C0991_001554 [Blastosporella zonata]|nr:hypothetical protein C0991_001554 [Blastosporella zonata]
MMISTGEALEYLHKNHVVHGSLHTQNILVHESGKAVLADYGLSQIYAERSSSFGDSNHVRYQAPELISGEIPTPSIASDVYSFGVVCYEALSSTQPYSDLGTEVDVILAIYEGQPPYFHANKRLFKSPNLDQVFWDLMLSCWSRVPRQRPDIGLVLEKLRSLSQVIRLRILPPAPY